MNTVEVAKNAARVRWYGHEPVKHHRACIEEDVWRHLVCRYDCYTRGKFASLAIKYALDCGLDFGLGSTVRDGRSLDNGRILTQIRVDGK